MTRVERIALALATALTGLRLAWCGRFELSPDEAYYTLWSQRLDLAYYSKGPGVALVIRAMTSLLGDTELGVRAASPLLGLVTSLVLWRLARAMFGGDVAGGVVIGLNALPIFNVGALLMTVDPLSISTWCGALLAGWRAVRRGPGWNAWWPLAGALVGLGFLCKYTNVVLLVGFALFLAVSPGRRREVAGPGFLSCLAAFLPFTLPFLLWNSANGWATVRHLQERGGLEESFTPQPSELLEFLVVHLGVYSPVLFALMLASIPWAWREARSREEHRYLLALALPLLAGYTAIALHRAGEANWTAPACVGLLVLACARFVPRLAESAASRRTVAAGLLVAALLSAIIVDTDLLRAAGAPLAPRSDPSTRLRGWRETARLVDELRASWEREHGERAVLVAHHYGLAAELAFYSASPRVEAPGHPSVYAPATASPRNQFWFWPGYRDLGPRPAIYLTDKKVAAPPDAFAADFATCEALPPLEVRRRGETLRTLRPFACR